MRLRRSSTCPGVGSNSPQQHRVVADPVSIDERRHGRALCGQPEATLERLAGVWRSCAPETVCRHNRPSLRAAGPSARRGQWRRTGTTRPQRPRALAGYRTLSRAVKADL